MHHLRGHGLPIKVVRPKPDHAAAMMDQLKIGAADRVIPYLSNPPNLDLFDME